MKEIVLDLVCELGDDELRVRGTSMSAAMLRYDEVELAKKEPSKDFAEEMKALRGQMRSLSKAIRSKSEVRPVQCGLQFHKPQVGMKRIVRMDTGEIVRDEVMSLDERQNNLFEDIQELDRLYGSGAEPDDKE